MEEKSIILKNGQANGLVFNKDPPVIKIPKKTAAEIGDKIIMKYDLITEKLIFLYMYILTIQ